MDINKVNINNLVSLWESVGDSFQITRSGKGFSYCQVVGSEWPNRLWFHGEDPKKETMKAAIEIVRESSVSLSVSYWGKESDTFESGMEAEGFVKKSEQIGMSLRLERELESLGRIRLRRVDSESDARLWSEIYPKSFGYAISATILLKTMVNIPFYLIYLDGQPIGTVIAYPTENAIGIHGLGILPQFRKQGFAEEAMGILLNNALHHNVQWATLQSSSMGKNMYLKLGFTEDFLMMTYKPS
ncbi:GNAT family N-acetyltransferase [Algoriphagus sp.]|uniref:GNAT family N-acetyltransferase n=1 Tax=Algoriphagus sp. TaxID=1872435 RepID=UPI003F6F5F70